MPPKAGKLTARRHTKGASCTPHTANVRGRALDSQGNGAARNTSRRESWRRSCGSGVPLSLPSPCMTPPGCGANPCARQARQPTKSSTPPQRSIAPTRPPAKPARVQTSSCRRRRSAAPGWPNTVGARVLSAFASHPCATSGMAPPVRVGLGAGTRSPPSCRGCRWRRPPRERWVGRTLRRSLVSRLSSPPCRLPRSWPRTCAWNRAPRQKRRCTHAPEPTRRRSSRRTCNWWS
mmetsp:Transcript_42196/g.97700  ORF Transcript_42196/g.97700 Transcript_42196/m.97700 type:complete len:234 (-) Transcript_42196:696-1397(-)